MSVKFPFFGGGFFGGGGEVPILFLWARGFFWTFSGAKRGFDRTFFWRFRYQQLRFGVFREGVFQKMPALEGQFLEEISVRFAGENHLRTQRQTQNKALRRGSWTTPSQRPFFFSCWYQIEPSWCGHRFQGTIRPSPICPSLAGCTVLCSQIQVRLRRHKYDLYGAGLSGANTYRRRTNVQQLTCRIDLPFSFYYLFFSFVLLELKPFVLKGKVAGEKLWKSVKKCEKVRKIMKRFCPLVVAL